MPIIDARTMVIVFVALCQIVCTAYALRDVSPDGTYDFHPRDDTNITITIPRRRDMLLGSDTY